MSRLRRQKVLLNWATKEFGYDEANSTTQRAIRLLEEAIEAYQAAQGSQEMAHKLIDYVFSRPTGMLYQELGGVGVTLLLLAESAGLDADEAEVDEIVRIRLKSGTGVFSSRNAEKNSAGFKAKEL